MERVLLVQLGANGDCLYATILARQLKHDHPNARVVWAIARQSAGLLQNNPYVDEIFEYDVPGRGEMPAMWREVERDALRCLGTGEFSRVVLSQIWPDHFENFDGTVRPSILRAYGAPITVPIETFIAMTGEETGRVEAFAKDQRLSGHEHRILFECGGYSSQSGMNAGLAQEVADHLYRRLPDATVIFSTHLPMTPRDRRSRVASSLSLREIAGLTHHCSLFVGAGSGGTVAASSTASKALPMIQVLAQGTSVFASFAHDFEFFGIQRPPVIETTSNDAGFIAGCIARACEGDARGLLDEVGPIPVTFGHYFFHLREFPLSQARFLDAAQSLTHTAERYGWTRDLLEFATEKVIPRLSEDRHADAEGHKERAGLFKAQVEEAARNPAEHPVQKTYAETIADA